MKSQQHIEIDAHQILAHFLSIGENYYYQKLNSPYLLSTLIHFSAFGYLLSPSLCHQPLPPCLGFYFCSVCCLPPYVLTSFSLKTEARREKREFRQESTGNMVIKFNSTPTPCKVLPKSFQVIKKKKEKEIICIRHLL